MRPRILIWLGLPALLVGLAIAVERLVVTDREAIGDLVDRAAEAAMKGDFPAFAETLDVEYQADGRDRSAMVEYIETRWRRYRPHGFDVQLGEIRLEGDEASAPIEVTVFVAGRPMPIPGEVHFVRRDDGWKIASAKPRVWPR